MAGKPDWRYYRETKTSINETLDQNKGNGNGKKIKQKKRLSKEKLGSKANNDCKELGSRHLVD